MSEQRDAAWARLVTEFRTPPQSKSEHVHWKSRLENAAHSVASAERVDALWEVLRSLHNEAVSPDEREGIDRAMEIVRSLDPAVRIWDDERMGA